MVWGGVCSTARTDLQVFPRGIMNSIVHVTDILEQFAPFIGDNFIFQHDNGRPHSVRVSGIASMQWPARSQDLNPIENIRVWQMMGRRVRALQPPPATLGELVEQIVAIWDNQDQADVLFNINSMGRRCEAAIHATAVKPA
jgi:hypothetical protein